MIQFVGLLGLVAFVAASLVVGGRILLLAAIVIDARTALKRTLSLDRSFLRVWGGP